MPSEGSGPQFDLCERHPDCLFQGGCECKRQQMRDRSSPRKEADTNDQ